MRAGSSLRAGAGSAAGAASCRAGFSATSWAGAGRFWAGFWAGAFGDWAALMASTSCAFFIEPAPAMPMPPAIDLRSASSIEPRPPDFEAFRAGFVAASGAASCGSAGVAAEAEGVSVTWILRTLRRRQ